VVLGAGLPFAVSPDPRRRSLARSGATTGHRRHRTLLAALPRFPAALEIGETVHHVTVARASSDATVTGSREALARLVYGRNVWYSEPNQRAAGNWSSIRGSVQWPPVTRRLAHARRVTCSNQIGKSWVSDPG
jgi:hypothetical protein